MRQDSRNIWERGKGQVRREKGQGAGNLMLRAITKLLGLKFNVAWALSQLPPA